MRYFILMLAACGGTKAIVGQPHQPYAEQATTSVGSGTVSVVTSDPNACIDTVDGACVKASRTGQYCSASSGPVDVIVVDGKAKETVCYPSPGGGKNPIVVKDASTAIDVAKTANGTAITFDAAMDGVAIAGPITLSANDVSLYGNGPDKTIIDGDLIVEKNNVRIRGVRIKGNLKIAFNSVSVVLSQIDGSLTSDKNNGLFASNKIDGDVTLDGNGNELYYNEVKGKLSAHGAECANNKDGTGSELTCK